MKTNLDPHHVKKAIAALELRKTKRASDLKKIQKEGQIFGRSNRMIQREATYKEVIDELEESIVYFKGLLP